MAYDFFFSYPRAVHSPFLEKFFRELHEEVRARRNLPEKSVVGFFDRVELEHGEDWPKDIKEALQTSKTFVPVYCAAYFQGTFCETELKIFLGRVQSYLKQNPDAAHPRVIRPVIWMPNFTLPPQYQNIQYNLESPLETDGLFDATRTLRTNNKQWRDYMKRLALAIIATADTVSLPKLDDFPPLITSESSVVEANDDEGPDYVRFVYVAATDAEVRELRSRVEYYGSRSRQWTPFLPEERRAIEPLAQSIAGDEGLGSGRLAFNDQLPEQVRLAEERGNLVIVLMDGWSVKLQSCRDVLRELDEGAYLNCCIIVPWNVDDEETARERTALTSAIRQTLRRWTRNETDDDPESFRYNTSITSFSDFRSRLGNILTRLKAEVHKSVPDGYFRSTRKPSISNALGTVK